MRETFADLLKSGEIQKELLMKEQEEKMRWHKALVENLTSMVKEEVEKAIKNDLHSIEGYLKYSGYENEFFLSNESHHIYSVSSPSTYEERENKEKETEKNSLIQSEALKEAIINMGFSDFDVKVLKKEQYVTLSKTNFWGVEKKKEIFDHYFYCVKVRIAW